MLRLVFIVLLAPLLATPCHAQKFPLPSSGELPVTSIELDKMPWKKFPGISADQDFATIVGDRAKPGFYIQLVRWPPHSILKAHSHPDDRYVMVLSGTFYHGIADKFDESKLEVRPTGSFFTEPKNVRHFGMTKDEGTVLYFVGTGPSTTDNLEK